MKHRMKLAIAAPFFGMLAACVENTGSVSATPGADEEVCLAAVIAETKNSDVAVLGSEFSEAGTNVTVGVGPQRARWQCIAYSDGTTSRPMSLTNEGSL